MWSMRRMLSAYAGTGAALVGVARAASGYSLYVPAVTYACRPELGDADCELLGESPERHYCRPTLLLFYIDTRWRPPGTKNAMSFCKLIAFLISVARHSYWRRRNTKANQSLIGNWIIQANTTHVGWAHGWWLCAKGPQNRIEPLMLWRRISHR